MSSDGKLTEPEPIPPSEEEKESSVGQSGSSRPSGTIREVISGACSAGVSHQPTTSLPRRSGATSSSASDTIRAVDDACRVLEPVSGVGGAQPNGARTERRGAPHDALGLGRRVGGANRDLSRYGLGRLGRGAIGDVAGESENGSGGKKRRWFLGRQLAS